jgi:hypothetical protein
MSWKDEVRYRERIAARTVDPIKAFEKYRRRNEPSADQRIAAAVKELRERAVPAPAAEPDDAETIERVERETRERRRSDTARRLKAPVIVEAMPDGTTKFKRDIGVSERRYGSGTTAPQ